MPIFWTTLGGKMGEATKCTSNKGLGLITQPKKLAYLEDLLERP